MRRSHAMAAGPSIDVTGWLEEQLAQASPDLLRSMVQTFAEALTGAEADAVQRWLAPGSDSFEHFEKPPGTCGEPSPPKFHAADRQDQASVPLVSRHMCARNRGARARGQVGRKRRSGQASEVWGG
jgi:hypothetical protein